MEEADFATIAALANDPDSIAPVEVQFLVASASRHSEVDLGSVWWKWELGWKPCLRSYSSSRKDTGRPSGLLLTMPPPQASHCQSTSKRSLCGPGTTPCIGVLDPGRPVALRAVEILDALIRTYSPGFSFNINRVRAHRPHRHDLDIVRSP